MGPSCREYARTTVLAITLTFGAVPHDANPTDGVGVRKDGGVGADKQRRTELTAAVLRILSDLDPYGLEPAPLTALQRTSTVRRLRRSRIT